jgi:hypothetical protein
VANGFGTINELQSGERQDAVLVERGLEGEVEAGERLDRRQLGHLYRHFNAAVFADRELFGEQGVDGFDGADFAAFDAAKSYIKDFQRARHLQAKKNLEIAGREIEVEVKFAQKRKVIEVDRV